jgi:nitrile hydratase accessory protein
LIPPELEAEKPFNEPWQAKAFALAVYLSGKGVFTWPEWADSFAAVAREHAGAADVSEAEAYWRNWVVNLERIMTVKGHGAPEQLDDLTAAWREAFETTPHGQPVELPELALRKASSTC